MSFKISEVLGEIDITKKAKVSHQQPSSPKIFF
jgi:hypothetical protein